MDFFILPPRNMEENFVIKIIQSKKTSISFTVFVKKKKKTRVENADLQLEGGESNLLGQSFKEYIILINYLLKVDEID